jgi:hypothetical protein
VRGIFLYTELLISSKTPGGPPGSRSRHLGIKRPLRTIIRYSLDSESPIFIGFCVQCVQCVPWLSRNVRDDIRDFPRFKELVDVRAIYEFNLMACIAYDAVRRKEPFGRSLWYRVRTSRSFGDDGETFELRTKSSTIDSDRSCK